MSAGHYEVEWRGSSASDPTGKLFQSYTEGNYVVSIQAVNQVPEQVLFEKETSRFQILAKANPEVFMFIFSKQSVLRIILLGLIILSSAGYSHAGCGSGGVCTTADEAMDDEQMELARLSSRCTAYIKPFFSGLPGIGVFTSQQVFTDEDGCVPVEERQLSGRYYLNLCLNQNDECCANPGPCCDKPDEPCCGKPCTCP